MTYPVAMAAPSSVDPDAPLDFTVHFRYNREKWDMWGAVAGTRERSQALARFIDAEITRALADDGFEVV